MRRIYIFPLLLLLSLTAVMVVAQEDPLPDEPTAVSTVIPDGSTPMPDPAQLSDDPFTNLNAGSFSVKAGEGSDFCTSATSISSDPGGARMDVASMTQSADDPVLNCIWGTPTSRKGYRTVWYKFTPEFNATMILRTHSSSPQAYDTVLAVYTGGCDNLAMLACNDDFIGFSSTVTMNVRRGKTYYIEVADWQAGGNAIKILDLSVRVDPFDTLWETQNSLPPTLTARQASLVIGSNLYLIGGRGANGNLVQDFQRLDTTTGAWKSLPAMPGDGLLNTTAVYLPPGNNTGSDGRIYLPGGSISANDQVSSREHVYYDIGIGDEGGWSPIAVPSLGNVGGTHVTEPFAYAAAARNSANNGYFLTGGVVGQGHPFTTTSTVRDQVLFYNPAGDTWTPKASMTSPRYGHVAAYLPTARADRQLCVAGGLNIDGGHVLIPNGECASAVSPSTWTATSNMQVPRYFAHSSVAPNGMWFVYGGVDGSGAAVPEVEVYNPATNSWSVLGLLYDLGGQEGKPIVWPGGGFVGDYLWTAGGSYDPSGTQLNPQVAKTQVEFLNPSLYLPFIANNQFVDNHSFNSARRMNINTSVSQNFASAAQLVNSNRQLVNVYKFDVNQQSAVQVALTSVAADAQVNLYLYNDNKLIIERDENPFPGMDKTVSASLRPGTYYVMVKYISSFNDNDVNDYYHLRVSN